MGKQYHVRKTTDTNYGNWYPTMQGTHPDGTNRVHTTIESALDVADDFDTIWVYPGQWKPTKVLAITQDHLKLLAVETGPNKTFTQTEIRQWGNVAANIITINAHGVEVAGFRLTPYGGTTYNAITVADAANAYGCYIHDNYFYAAAQVGSIMKCGSSSFNADSISILNNEFWKGGTAGDQSTNAALIMKKAYKFLFAKNTITCIGSGQIYMYCTDEVSNSKILDNVFFGAESGVIAIHIGTATAGDYCIDGNHGVNIVTGNLVETESVLALGINYVGITAEPLT